ncbi:Tail Collar domain protein [Dickeya parazeae Ech586]|uniref:Tail Collar domain protein n=1 Tax=Dickeya zeae (strain Ech586) TaxID=590409 RepID=D2BZE9_DICZ5|nr:phage tail protein [Dickeya parazeae]ACZ78821.1 Tail Collar domain protein [Dickeya parazeae Ech586]
MAVKYMTLLTQVGAAKLANATALGKMLNITHMGVGDGGGNPTTPYPTQTALINEKRRAVLNALRVDPNNPNQIIAEQVIPENEGGFWLREIGLYDADGDLIAVANCPDTYKPLLQEGSGRVQTVRMILVVSNASAVTLKVDPSVVLATRQSVDDKAIEVKAYADGLMTNHVSEANPHKQYAPIESPALTGIPSAPTAVAGTTTTQLATTAFVAGAVNALSDKTDNNIKLKLDINDIVGIPLPWPQANVPSGWLKCNGQAFDKNRYPRLAQVYPSGVLPDLRGEFIRGWDDGRGVDNGRAILSGQTGSIVTGDIGNNINMATVNFDSHSENRGKLGWDIVGLDANNYPDLRVNIVSGALAATNPYPYCGVSRPRNIAFSYILRAA